MSEQSRGGEKRHRPSGQKPNKTILRRTLMLMAVCGIAAFIVLAVKLYQIQIVQHDKYQKLAVEQQTRETTVAAARGTIFDASGKILAMSASVETVFISPFEMDLYDEDKNLIATTLASILDIDKDKILQKMEDTNSWYKTIRTKIESDLSEQIRSFIQDNKLKSVHMEPDSKRYYPNASLASHVIGFVGSDNYGLNGLELHYNSYLEGIDGRIVRLKNAKGTDMLFSDFEDYFDARNGNDITLTIDSTIQYYVEKYVAQAIEDYDVQDGATCIVMRPSTGEVLALVSFDSNGSYDPNNYQVLGDDVQQQLDLITDPDEYNKQFSAALLAQQRNKALSDTYEPGSVFKIITCATALEENVVGLDDTFYCDGSMEVKGRGPLKCWKTAGHGTQTLLEAMQHSCNVALVSIGLKIGADTFYDYIEAFGLFEKTAIDLPGEGRGIWWSDEVFKKSDNLSSLAAAAFGQTFKITPLQMITAVSAVVNGGNLMQPYIVKQISDADGNIVLANEPTAVRQVISSETSKTMCDILEQVVGGEEGTGKNAYVPGYKVGGKTGTSEDTEQDTTEGAPKPYIVSFMGVAPTDDPQVVILLLLDNPSHESGIYISGGNMAAPVVGRILSEVLPYLGIKPEYTDEEKKILDIPVPKLIDKTIEEAARIIEKEGLTVRIVGEGDTVTAQLPSVNITVAPGSQVILYAGGEKPDEMITVPDLYGKSYSDAKKALENAGLFIKSGGTLSTSSNVVVSIQSAPKNTQLPIGSVVEVTLVDENILGYY